MRTTTEMGAFALMGLMLATAAGCGGGFDSEDGSGMGGSAGAAGEAGSAGSGGTRIGPGGAAGSAGAAGMGATGGSGGMTGPQDLAVVLRATTEAYPHDDDFASQTARSVSAGVRSLELIDDQGGRWVLLDAAPGNVEVGYDDGEATELARVPEGEARPGHYVRGRLVQDWSRFEVSAALHELTVVTEGDLRILQVTSEGALVGGTPMPLGHYEHAFESPGKLESFEGQLEVPDYSETAEAEAYLEEGLWAVYFPVDLVVSGDESGTLEVLVNMDRAFRWTDMPAIGNADNVYDIAPPLYEPVEQFGGNRFSVALITP